MKTNTARHEAAGENAAVGEARGEARGADTAWETAARQGIAFLRLSGGRYPEDPAIVALVGELSVRSGEFRTWWAQHDVQDRGSGRKGFNHPLAGRACTR
ncbi:MmyB family transcriptional regulator [Streptomyces sp. NPDC054783]